MNKVGVAMVVQNDAETIERVLASFYDHVETIVVSTDRSRGWTGAPIKPDHTVDLIRSYDRHNKIEIIEDDFYKDREAWRNETYQRQETSDRVVARSKDRLDWVLQVDADEEFLDFAGMVARLDEVPRISRCFSGHWLQLYNVLDDGRYLVITHPDGRPLIGRFHLGHRPYVRLKHNRRPRLPFKPLRKVFPFEYNSSYEKPLALTLHYTWARSEGLLREKVKTWSHAGDIDGDQAIETWLRSKADWQSMENFHPMHGPWWPALRPFSMAELLAISSRY